LWCSLMHCYSVLMILYPVPQNSFHGRGVGNTGTIAAIYCLLCLIFCCCCCCCCCCCSDLTTSFKKYASASFVCCIKDWIKTSPFPIGYGVILKYTPSFQTTHKYRRIFYFLFFVYCVSSMVYTWSNLQFCLQ